MTGNTAKLALHGGGQQGFGLPRTPQTVDETGLNLLFLVELVCKILFLNGQMRLVDLATQTKLSLGVLEPVMTFMRAEHLAEATRGSETSTHITYFLSDAGRVRAQDYLRKSQYAGPAPVTLQSYNERVRLQSVSKMRVTRERIAEVFQRIVLRQSILDQFGTAMNSGRAIFVYGPAGGGKTFIAEHLAGLLTGYPMIPHAVLVEGEIIQIFDPLMHKPVAMATSSALDRGPSFDSRWTPCHRPVVITGGELTLGMLDLDFDESARFYQAPPQVKANNGLLIIDDLGRQLVSPQNLMNRWIVPLDRRLDYLALHTGTKFMVPFDVVVIFSSNLAPSTLADEAFLRRLGYKIYIGELNVDEYRAIFVQTCEAMGVPYFDEGFDFVLNELHRKRGKPLLACIPRDLLGQVRDYSQFRGVEPRLTPFLLEWAWDNYFARDAK